MQFVENKIFIKFNDKYDLVRPRLNCSLNEGDKWRWIGLQFTVETD